MINLASKNSKNKGFLSSIFSNDKVEYPPFKIDTKTQFYDIPNLKDKEDVNIRYPLIRPYSFAKIYWSNELDELIYEVQEPSLDEKLENVLKVVKGGLEELINVKFAGDKVQKLIDFLRHSVISILNELGFKLTSREFLKVMYYIYRDFIGFNKIDPLLSDFYIEDIECNGLNSPIYIVHRKFENIRTNISFNNIDELTELVEKMAQKSGRYVSYSQPLLDATLPDGSRINATYTKDITTRGPTFTIRKFTREPWTPINLMQMNSVDASIFAYIWLAIENRLNVIVIGETGSGKTTFLNAFTEFIPPEARICSIEDTRELNLPHENWLPSVTRQGFNVGSDLHAGEVTLFDLLKESFRQNPDYVIVGEIRGAEASVLFQGMASGHSSFGTFHASSPESLVRRLQTPPINLSSSLVETMDIVAIAIHNKEQKRNIRRIKGIVEIEKVTEAGAMTYNEFFKWNPKKDTFEMGKNSNVLRKISDLTGTTIPQLLKELKRRTKFLERIKNLDLSGFEDFNEAIQDYYVNAERAMKKYEVK